MPRGNRFHQPGMICHLTHRCHNRDYLFRFGCDRSEYRERLRLASKEFGVSLLNYCTTSSHSHEIAIESTENGISRMMHKVEGEFGLRYNRRKKRSGAFWEDRYHCTMIENGEHLWNGIQYVDLNMVRAGVVSHPSEWQWCGYTELIGKKTRYCLLNVDLLLALLGQPDLASFQAEYSARILGAISKGKLNREARWTESVAVGGKQFVERIGAAVRHERHRLRYEENEDGSWALWEQGGEYQSSSRRAIGLKRKNNANRRAIGLKRKNNAKNPI